MKLPPSFACDVCKRVKEDVNHWFIVSRGEEIILTHWEKAKPEAIETADFHLCGVAHLLQIISRLCESPTKTLEGEPN